jgi:hypothetical protein
MSGGLDPLHHGNDRLSAGSATSLLSDDSGYASLSPEIDLPSPKPTNKRFGLGALFKRKDRSNLETHSRSESSSDSALRPSTPLREVIEAEEESATT